MSDSKNPFELLKGRFTQVANEMLENLAKMDLTPTEFRICVYLIRELVGWDYAFKPIELTNFMIGTGDGERQIVRALKSLVQQKEVLLKRKVPEYRTPCYGLNPEKFGRVTVVEPRGLYIEGSNVIDLKTFKIMKQTNSARSDGQNCHLESDRTVSQKVRQKATRAAEQAPKDTETPINTLLEGGGRNLTWERARGILLQRFPNDTRLIDKAYQQISVRGYEKEGKSPFAPKHLPAWFLSQYETIRIEYAHLGEKRA